MSRLDPAAFDLGPPVQIENGPLLYHDDAGGARCTSVKASTLPDELVFEPELIFGPVCVSVPWQELFSSPDVPDLTGLPIRDGSASLAADPVAGSYTDVSGGGGCRVFEPGHYTTPPDTSGDDAYFKTGDYVMDFADEWEVRQAVVSAGRMNPLTTTTPEIPMTNACQNAQLSDPAPPEETGATFYFAGGAHLNVATQGSIEIHARQQGTDYVSVQTLCTPNGGWCRPSGDGGLGPGAASTLTAPGTSGVGQPDLHRQRQQQRVRCARARVRAACADRVRQRDQHGDAADVGWPDREPTGAPVVDVGHQFRDLRTDESDHRRDPADIDCGQRRTDLGASCRAVPALRELGR